MRHAGGSSSGATEAHARSALAPKEASNDQFGAGEWSRLAREHYENFPVLSVLVPRALRGPIAAIYAFARITDDIGDEGEASPEERLAALDRWERDFDAALAAAAAAAAGSRRHAEDGRESARRTTPDSDLLLGRLASVIVDHGLPVEAFHALIEANRVDQRRARYGTYDELLEYCALSANPVGRIVLALFGRRDGALAALADAVCTGLQLANHVQGVGEDLRLRDRLYLPLEDLQTFGVGEEELRRGRDTARVRRLVLFEAERARDLLRLGTSLPLVFRGRRAMVLRLFLDGGNAILEEIAKDPARVLRERLEVSRPRAVLGFARAVAATIARG